MLKETLRPAWVEINLNHIRYNMKNIVAKVGLRQDIIGVVKADAYGHGIAPVSRILLENGVSTLAVATLDEAATLRRAGFSCPIVMLGLTPDLYADALCEYDITPVTASFENAKAISSAAERLGKKLCGFVAVDTGMGRIGLSPDSDGIQEMKRIRDLSNFFIRGLFSHFATSDEADKSYARMQLQRFNDFHDKLTASGISIPYRTIANSAAVMEMPETHLDGVRPGIILYGCYPSDEVNRSQLEILPAMSVKAEIVQLKTVTSGTDISYGRRFTAQRESLIGTLTLGYADGYSRSLNGQGRVIINGVFAPVVGNVCMDQCMVDVTEVPGVKLGDEVILMGGDGKLSISADEIAKKTNTINYEIMCAFGQRLPKVYINR